MTKIKHRCLAKEGGAIRYCPEYVHDPRDLDANGKPPSWFLQQDRIEAELDEIEFDHIPGEIELAAYFKRRKDNG